MVNSMNRNGQSNGDFCHHIAQVAGTISYIFLYANLLRVRVHVYESRDLRFFWFRDVLVGSSQYVKVLSFLLDCMIRFICILSLDSM